MPCKATTVELISTDKFVVGPYKYDFQIERDGACVQCGATSMLNAHHVIPREEGGPDVCRGHTGAMVDLALGSSERLC